MAHSDNEDLGPVFISVDTVLYAISTAFILARLFTRIWITRNIGWDDATIVLAYLLTALGKGFVAVEIHFGLGQHRSRLSGKSYEQYLKYESLDWLQFFIALAVCKISICLFLLRLSQMNRLRLVLYGTIAFLLTTHIPLFLMLLLQCSPIQKTWYRQVPGSCLSMDVIENIILAQGGTLYLF